MSPSGKTLPMRSNTRSPEFVGKTNGLCQSPSFLDQEEAGSGYEIEESPGKKKLAGAVAHWLAYLWVNLKLTRNFQQLVYKLRRISLEMLSEQ